MAWIESHQELGGHPKTKKLARILGVSLPTAVGHLQYFWWWALNYAQNGALDRYDSDDIADAALWEGESQKFFDALVEVGFVDLGDDGIHRIHDWDDYAGRLIDQRQHINEQKRRHRELYNNKSLIMAIKDRDKDQCRYCGRQVSWANKKGADGATYDYIDPEGPTELNNIVIACRACSAGKGRRTPEQAGYKLLPPPNKYPQKFGQDLVNIQPVSTPTVPNLTVPNQVYKTSLTPPKNHEECSPETNLRERFPRYTNDQWRIIDDYWDLVRFTRKTGKVAESIILREMEYWERFNVDLVIESLRIHIGKYGGKTEQYTRGIMRRLKMEKERGREGNVQPGGTKPAYDTGKYAGFFKPQVPPPDRRPSNNRDPDPG